MRITFWYLNGNSLKFSNINDHYCHGVSVKINGSLIFSYVPTELVLNVCELIISEGKYK